MENSYTKQIFNIPAKHGSNNRVKILEVLKVKESVDMGEYSEERMLRISSSISYFKKKKGNSKKKFCQRKVSEGGVLIIRLWRTK